jgi:hypothetical protein
MTPYMNVEPAHRRIEIGSTGIASACSARGILRDTWLYSVLDQKWLVVRANHAHQSSRPRD